MGCGLLLFEIDADAKVYLPSGRVDRRVGGSELIVDRRADFVSVDRRLGGSEFLFVSDGRFKAVDRRVGGSE